MDAPTYCNPSLYVDDNGVCRIHMCPVLDGKWVKREDFENASAEIGRLHDINRETAVLAATKTTELKEKIERLKSSAEVNRETISRLEGKLKAQQEDRIAEVERLKEQQQRDAAEMSEMREKLGRVPKIGPGPITRRYRNRGDHSVKVKAEPSQTGNLMLVQDVGADRSDGIYRWLFDLLFEPDDPLVPSNAALVQRWLTDNPNWGPGAQLGCEDFTRWLRAHGHLKE